MIAPTSIRRSLSKISTNKRAKSNPMIKRFKTLNPKKEHLNPLIKKELDTIITSNIEASAFRSLDKAKPDKYVVEHSNAAINKLIPSRKITHSRIIKRSISS
jgi:hypothetical protein